MIRPLYVFRRKDQNCVTFGPAALGQIIETDDVENAFKFLEMKITPDPTHQSSLDYLKGV